ncbi:MAG TPA: type 4a pilus biogenesis protein PilO [Phycisphaerae bacterium]|nr:type 4a pilus biogenesis protein PilO [Phycisphaerae bacterium]
MKFGIREIILLVLLVIIPVSAWALAFRPAKIRNEQMIRQIESQRTKLTELNRATGTIGNMEAEIESLNEAINYFSAKLPSEKEMDQVIRELWRLAEANELTTKSIRPLYDANALRLTESSGPYAEQPMSMVLEGRFKGLDGFLLAMERQPRIMRLLDMTVADLRENKEGGDGRVRTTCVMSVFFERASKE